MYLFILLFTLCFIIFIELYFGSILFRSDETNKIVMNIPSLLNFLVHPLHNSFLWHTQVICGNYPFMLLLVLLLYFTKFDFPWNLELSHNGLPKGTPSNST